MASSTPNPTSNKTSRAVVFPALQPGSDQLRTFSEAILLQQMPVRWFTVGGKMAVLALEPERVTALANQQGVKFSFLDPNEPIPLDVLGIVKVESVKTPSEMPQDRSAGLVGGMTLKDCLDERLTGLDGTTAYLLEGIKNEVSYPAGDLPDWVFRKLYISAHSHGQMGLPIVRLTPEIRGYMELNSEATLFADDGHKVQISELPTKNPLESHTKVRVFSLSALVDRLLPEMASIGVQADHNKRMQAFLRSHGFPNAVPMYIDKGSMRGTWRIYNKVRGKGLEGYENWTLDAAEKLNALGFSSYDGKPLGQHSGNGGYFQIFARYRPTAVSPMESQKVSLPRLVDHLLLEGFSRYWENPDGFTDEQWTAFTAKAKQIIQAAARKKIVLAGGNGTGKPVVDDKVVMFNGANPDGYETCTIQREGDKFGFCKTAQKPYDVVVKAILDAAAQTNPDFTVTSG